MSIKDNPKYAEFFPPWKRMSEIDGLEVRVLSIRPGQYKKQLVGFAELVIKETGEKIRCRINSSRIAAILIAMQEDDELPVDTTFNKVQRGEVELWVIEDGD